MATRMAYDMPKASYLGRHIQDVQEVDKAAPCHMMIH